MRRVMNGREREAPPRRAPGAGGVPGVDRIEFSIAAPPLPPARVPAQPMPPTRPTSGTPCRPLPGRVLATLLLCGSVATAIADDAAEIRALVARGDLAAALQRAERAAAANPRDVQARFLQGVVLMDLQRNDDAMALFTRLSQAYPELPDPLNNIALLHARAGRLEMARQALESALRNDPGHRTARANLGQVHLMLAVQAWEQLASEGVLDVPLQRQLDGARSLLGAR